MCLQITGQTAQAKPKGRCPTVVQVLTSETALADSSPDLWDDAASLPSDWLGSTTLLVRDLKHNLWAKPQKEGRETRSREIPILVSASIDLERATTSPGSPKSSTHIAHPQCYTNWWCLLMLGVRFDVSRWNEQPFIYEYEYCR